MPFETLPGAIVFSVAGIFVLATLYRAYRLSVLKSRIGARSNAVIDAFFHKVDKIPAIVETVRRYSPASEIYGEFVALHKAAIVSNVASVYDILETDARISGKFRFLMKLSVRIREISRDGNFLYARSLWMYYENVVREELEKMAEDIREYERLRRGRAFTVFGLFIPAKEILPVKRAD